MSAKHECGWPGCSRQVFVERFACGEHWHVLPQYIRDEIWRGYRVGPASSDHLIAIARAIAWVRATFDGVVDKRDPGKWYRLCRFVRERDEARARRRAFEASP